MGVPVGEIWRFDLDTGDWTHVFGPYVYHQERVGIVLAVAYDEERGKLIVLDMLPSQGSGAAPVTRVVVFDTHKGTSRVAAVVDVGAFTKTGMTARADGSFVLVGARPAQAGWSAYQFRLATNDDLSWYGTRSGTGQVLADPSFSDVGASLFTLAGQSST